ncbi:ferredoxin--nitrite reductase [Elstera cyanobacteriorum]|uniref:Sulfite reductase n=1 Tax=Elstera cyanobacteriorum TaxID=2022747 RepID=A0A255XNS4_9PROT|nr:nitrite/sulfite reductase [Elstera cyanobacteriorum]OYQ17910.1 sulfite reductase [Elstera cyanobacteriorum]GFZ85192.1 ferredoxin--nitrite reductase [Elstera cyanobacteriorum]
MAQLYRYDDFDKAFLAERVAQFRDQVNRRLAGDITEDQFKPLRLQNGLYLQLHAYMLRVAIPYGTLDARQMRALAQVARRFDKGYGHFTTRQNIQFNWIKLEDAADALALLAEVDVHAIQTSGNCIRNVTSDQFAGVAADEVEDPRPWGEIIRQWSTLHPEFGFLPRKFKIAITGGAQDRGAVKIHDIGLRLVKNDSGEIGFQVLVGGGLGRTPLIAKVIRDFLPKPDLLRYLEAILRVYNRYGRRDNIYKARIKILVQEIGIDRMRDEVEAEFAATPPAPLTLPDALVAAIRAHFAPVAYRAEPEETEAYATARAKDKAFAAWAAVNVAAHRQPGYGIVTITLKPAGGIPGDATAEQMEAIADLAERYSHNEIRVSHAQNLVLPHVRKADLPVLFAELQRIGFAEGHLNTAADIIACPGLDYCALANARSIPVAQEISEQVTAGGRLSEIGPVQIKISGCINACGHHHVGHIGLLGVDKGGEEFYQITLGGHAGDDAEGSAAVGTILGPSLPIAETAAGIDRVFDAYLALRTSPEETFIETVRRLGVGPFKERVYAAG